MRRSSKRPPELRYDRDTRCEAAILDGDNAAIGTPVVSGAKVEAKVVKNGKGKKVRIFKPVQYSREWLVCQYGFWPVLPDSI